jgi:hypothetical protein
MKIEAAVARRRGRAGAKRQMTPFDTPEYRRKDRARARGHRNVEWLYGSIAFDVLFGASFLKV